MDERLTAMKFVSAISAAAERATIHAGPTPGTQLTLEYQDVEQLVDVLEKELREENQRSRHVKVSESVERSAIVEWVKGFGIPVNLVPEDAIDIVPAGDGETLIRWEQWRDTLDAGFYSSARTQHTKVVAGVPPVYVRSGRVVSSTELTCPFCGHQDGVWE